MIRGPVMHPSYVWAKLRCPMLLYVLLAGGHQHA